MSHGKYDHLDLPENPTIEGLTLLLGEELVGQLSIDLGGSVVSIPQKATENSVLSFILGQEAAQKLSDIWGGMTFTVPLNVGTRAKIKRMLRDGKSVNLIARVTRSSRGLIYRVIDEEAQKNQLDMF